MIAQPLRSKYVSALLAIALLLAQLAPLCAQQPSRMKDAPATQQDAGRTRKGGPTAGADKRVALPAPDPAQPLVAGSVTATLSAQIANDDGDSKLDPTNGQTNTEKLTYTATLSNNTASDAAGVSFTDTIDAHTTLVNGSVNSSPLALADTYNVIGDASTLPFTQSAPGMLANDFDPDNGTNNNFAVVSYGKTTGAEQAAVGSSTQTAQNGTVTVQANGSFSYTPANGFQGTDTFKYKITDGTSFSNNTDTGTVTLIVDAPPKVTSTTPINGATGVAINAPITINFSENVNAASGFATINCGSAVLYTPTTASNASSIVLTPTGGLPPGSDCTITLDHTKITDVDANDPPDQMLADYVFSYKVNPQAVNDTYPVTLVGNVSTDSSTNVSPLPFSSTANDVSAAAYTITAFDATSANGGNVAMTTSGANIGKFTYDPPAGFEGNDTFTYTISRTDGGGSAIATVTIPVSGMVWFINNNAASCTAVSSGCGRLSHPFSTLAAFNSANGQADAPASHVFNPAANDNVFIYESGTGYSGAVTLLTGQKLIGQDATSPLFGAGSVTGLSVPAGSPASSSPAVPTMNSGNATATSITSTVTLNTSATVRGLSINSTTNTGMSDPASAITGVNVSEVKVATTTGTAVSLSDVDGTLSYTSVSCDGAANGIVLKNFALTSGSFTVTGSGSAGSGGTIKNIAGSDAAGIIPAATENAGSGVFLYNAKNVSLSWMQLNDNQNYAIYGNTVTGFTLGHSVINGTNGNNDQRDEGSIAFDNLLGSGSITNSNVSGGWEDNLRLRNTTGTLNRLTMDTDTWGPNSASFGNASLNMAVQPPSGSATMNVTVNNCTFTGSRSHFVQFLLNNNASPVADFVFTNNTITNSMASVSGAGGVFVSSATSISATFTFNISNNVIHSGTQPILGGGINVSHFGTSTYNGTISGNTIGTSGVANSGSSQGNGIAVLHFGGGSYTVGVTNNTVRRYNNIGIEVQVGDNTSGGQGKVNATITGNTVAEPDSLALHGLDFNIGTTAGDAHCVALTVGGAGALKNTLTGSGVVANGGFEIRARQRFNTTIRLQGYGGANNDNSAVATFLANQNTTSGTGAISPSNNVAGGGGGYQSGSCPLLFARGGVRASMKAPLASVFNAGLFSVADMFTSGGGADALPAFARQNSAEGVGIVEATIDPNVVAPTLTQQQLDRVVTAAIGRWTAVGLTAEQASMLRGLKFEATDLSGSYLGEATGDHILFDRSARGYGWFVATDAASDAMFAHAVSATRGYADPQSAPAGRVDLLTAVEHEMGHRLGRDDTYSADDRDNIMYGYLTLGERRLPTALLAGAGSAAHAGPHFLKLGGPPSRAEIKRAYRPWLGQDVSRARAVKETAMFKSARHDASPRADVATITTATLFSGETITINGSGSGFTLSAGKTVTVVFTVTLNNPSALSQMSPTPQVSNFGTLSGSFGPGINTATISTPVDRFHSATTLGSNNNPAQAGSPVTFTATVAFDTAEVSPTPSTPTTPTGSVNFIDASNGNASVCSNVALTGGQAQCQTSSLSAGGTHNIQAVYGGDGNYNNSTSNTVAQQVVAPPALSVSDVAQAEGNAGQTAFTFTVSLDSPAGAGGVSFNWSTTDGTATAPSDYMAVTNAVGSIPQGSTSTTVNVQVNGDTVQETNETFFVNISGVTNATVSDGQGQGTILNDDGAPAAGQIIISEFRLSGPDPDGAGPLTGAQDEFIELYNNTDSDFVVADSSPLSAAQAGWAIVSSDAPTTAKVVVPAGTTIPARSHFLTANGTGYSLSAHAAPDAPGGVSATYNVDIPDGAGLALFRTNNPALFVLPSERLDSVGFTGAPPPFFEGTPLSPAGGITAAAEHSFVRQLLSGRPQDTDDNSSDFVLVSTTGGGFGGIQAALGAPGPENLASPVSRTAVLKASLIDPCASSSASPNRDRQIPGGGYTDTLSGTGNYPSGYLDVRRRFSNMTGANVTRLRFRVADITGITGTSEPAAGTADLRVVSSPALTVNRGASCGGDTIPVRALTLEQPPTQGAGGGLNSTVADGTITLAQPLGPGQAADVTFRLAVKQPGTFRFFVIVEALP